MVKINNVTIKNILIITSQKYFVVLIYMYNIYAKFLRVNIKTKEDLFMEKYIRKLGRNSIVLSIVLLVFGLFMFTRPISTINVLMIVFGVILVLDGLVHLVSYFSIKNDYRFFSGELVQAIIYIILGFVLMINYYNVSYLLPIILGIWIIVDSIFKLQISMNIRDIYDSHWGVLLALSILTGLFGMIVLFNPVSSLELLTRVCGAILMIVELISIFEDISIISRVGKFDKLEKEIKKEYKEAKSGK